MTGAVSTLATDPKKRSFCVVLLAVKVELTTYAQSVRRRYDTVICNPLGGYDAGYEVDGKKNHKSALHRKSKVEICASGCLCSDRYISTESSACMRGAVDISRRGVFQLIEKQKVTSDAMVEASAQAEIR